MMNLSFPNGMLLHYIRNKCLKTSPDFSPWIAINANNKMIARCIKILAEPTDYEEKKLLNL